MTQGATSSWRVTDCYSPSVPQLIRCTQPWPIGLSHRSEVKMRRGFWFAPRTFLVAVLAMLLSRATTALAQGATLSGVITSEAGQPLENANAYITELNISVATNAQGRYNIVIAA